MHFVILALPPLSPWVRHASPPRPEKLKSLMENRDQQRLRAYWGLCVERLRYALLARGHSVDVRLEQRWNITPEYISTIEADAFFIPHTSRHLFETGRNVFFYMQVMQPWLFTVDKGGWSASSSRYPAVEYKECRDFSGVFEEYQARLMNNNDSKFRQPPRRSRWQLRMAGIIPNAPYIFLPLQVPHDESILYHSDVEMADVLKRLVAWCNAKKVHLVVKGHPGNLAIRDELKPLAAGPHVRWVDGSIHDLMTHAAAVYTINSGVGFEALLHEKPVVTFGRVEYDAVTIHGRVDSLDDAWAQVKAWNKETALTEYRRFFEWFCRVYALDLENEARLAPRLHKLCEEIELRAGA